jgi:hypothetical protein
MDFFSLFVVFSTARAANGVISAKTMYQKTLTTPFIINHELGQCHKDNITKWLAAKEYCDRTSCEY